MKPVDSSKSVVDGALNSVNVWPNPHNFLILIICLALTLIIGGPIRLSAGDGRSTGATAKSANDDHRAESESNPLGLPDYTKITGYVETTQLPIEEAEVLWSVFSGLRLPNGDVAPNPISDPVYAEGVLYFGDDQGAVTALNVKDQTVRWTYEHRHRISVAPSVDHDFVYFGSKTGITALRRDDGRIAWNFAIALGAAEATPIPVGDFVFASGYDGNAYCLNRMTGVSLWTHHFVNDAPQDPKGFEGKRARFGEIAARPNGSACDGQVFVQSVFDQSRVIAVDCKTGKRTWTFQAAGWISPAPTIANGRVYVSSQDEHLYCVDLTSGELIWKFKTESWLASRAAVHDGQVFLPAHGAKLYQLAADTGQFIRLIQPPDEQDRDGAVYSFPIIAHKTAYFASGPGLFFAFDIESGNMRWKIRPSEGSELFTNPKTDGRQIFVATRPSLRNKNAPQEGRGESSIVSIGIER